MVRYGSRGPPDDMLCFRVRALGDGLSALWVPRLYVLLRREGFI